jgi:hypothetical protein
MDCGYSQEFIDQVVVEKDIEAEKQNNQIDPVSRELMNRIV